MHIESLDLRVIYNSRVKPTVEAEINGVTAAAPSGASTGTHEALCFVPEDIQAIEEELAARVEGEEFSQEEFDAELAEYDGTDNFAEIGAVAIASSFAFKKAAGMENDLVYPYPVGNLLGGGAHGGNTSIQEFLVIPTAAGSVPEAMEILSNVYHGFRDRHKRRITGTNDEGAYITKMGDEESLQAVTEVAEEHGARVGLDVAATEFYEDGTYSYGALGEEMTPEEQVKFMERLVDTYDLLYLEDPFEEDDFEHLAELTDRVSDALIVGDDTFVTQVERLQRAVEIDAGNAIIVKPNQAGTVTAARETIELALENGYVPTVSHRSGETTDPVIADLALEWGAPLMKAGIGGIRTAKNNELLRQWDRHGGEMADLGL